MRAYLVAIVLLLIIFGTIGGYLYQRFGALASMDFSPPPVTIAAAKAQEQSWKQVKPQDRFPSILRSGKETHPIGKRKQKLREESIYLEDT